MRWHDWDMTTFMPRRFEVVFVRSWVTRWQDAVYSVQCSVSSRSLSRSLSRSRSVQCAVYSVRCSVGAQPRRVGISKQLQWAVFSTQLGSQQLSGFFCHEGTRNREALKRINLY